MKHLSIPLLSAMLIAASLFITPAAAFAADGILQVALPSSGDLVSLAVAAAAGTLYPIRLLQTAIIDNKPRSPAEGIQMVSKAERDRLVDDVGHAEDADADVEGDDAGDGLEDQKVPQLRKLAGKEGAVFESDANKAAVIAAIRERRALFADSGIDVQPDDGLRTIATDEGFEVADDADTAALVTAIRDGRANA